MSTYHYELPTTGAISFADFCVDESSSYAVAISEATQARANLRTALKESKRDHGEKDYLRLIKVRGIIAFCNRRVSTPSVRDLGLCCRRWTRIEDSPSWRTTLSANLFHSSPRLLLPTLFAEIAFTLLTYAFTLSNLARSSVASLGSYERERGISDIERKAKDEKLNFAVTLLCKASGIFSHVSEDILVSWDKSIALATSPDVARPPDLSREVNAALAKLALADAQSLAIRKLLSKSAYDSTVTPGPPLPASHPSPALLAKLHLECSALYFAARSLAKTPSSSRNKGKSKELPAGADGEVSVDLRRYLLDEGTFHAGISRKWLGVDAGENGGTPRAGEAVAFLAWAKKDLEELKMERSFVPGKTKSLKGKLSQELDAVVVFFKHYKNVNDSLSFQPVPPESDLQSRIPAGRMAVAPRQFVPPTPAFGPGSIEHTRLQAEVLELNDSVTSTTDSPQTKSIAQSEGAYAGAGSYF
ncbi:hypothetical protein HWV62_24249 [Athelia sp. TMB]|nr:hypothetical protein HWV62_24249 [Athelia sp. TMB]